MMNCTCTMINSQTQLVTCLLVILPHLSSLVTLLVCSLYNLLVFAVPCWFVVLCCVCLVSCPALPCLALSCPASLFFPYGVVFVCIVYVIINKNPLSLLHLSPRPHPFSVPDRSNQPKEDSTEQWASPFSSARGSQCEGICVPVLVCSGGTQHQRCRAQGHL